MDDTRDLVLVERALDRREIGDVALHQHDRGFVVAEHELESAPVVSEVVADDRVAVVEHAARDPGAEAAERSGDEHSLSQGVRPGRRSRVRCRTPSRPGPARVAPTRSS